MNETWTVLIVSGSACACSCFGAWLVSLLIKIERRLVRMETKLNLYTE